MQTGLLGRVVGGKLLGLVPVLLEGGLTTDVGLEEGVSSREREASFTGLDVDEAAFRPSYTTLVGPSRYYADASFGGRSTAYLGFAVGVQR